MNRLIQLIFIALLTLATSTNAYADCGNCPGDAQGEKHEHGENHTHGDKAEKSKECDSKAEKTAECGCAKAKDGGSAWCGHCKVGTHEGQKYNCEGCYKKATGEIENCTTCSDKKKEVKET